jgi:phosphoglycerate dehydrogenase-like enzyme
VGVRGGSALKVVYAVRNRGIATRTPADWASAVISAGEGGAYSEDDLHELAQADALVVGLEPVDEAVLAAAPRLRLVQRLGVGYSNIDVEAADRRKIPVCNMPDFNAATVAEHTIMMMLALLRRLFDSTLLMKAGRWPIETVAGAGIYDLRGKRVGIVGFGAIGQAVAARLQPFEVDAVYHDIRAADGPARRVALDELVRTSDIVTLHVLLTLETRGLIGAAELGAMKRTAIIVNTARAAVVDEVALADALREGSVAGAGLDVFGREPVDPSDPLLRLPNVLLTPHTAGQTREAMEKMVAAMLENLGRVERGEELRYRIGGA